MARVGLDIFLGQLAWAQQKLEPFRPFRLGVELDAAVVEKPRAWVLTIVRNTTFTWLAKNRPKMVLLTDDAELLAADREVDKVLQGLRLCVERRHGRRDDRAHL